ncbi:MAG: hypothetical protein LAN70_03290 [Acidobacteriia bacterium]|nr:hypothetical protein [Terriglobia bacterium]
MGQPNVVSEISRHNGNGHEVSSESAALYQAGFEAGFAAGKQAGYRQGLEAGLAQACQQVTEPRPQPPAAAEPGKRNLIGLPCPICGTYLYTDEQCPRCKQGVKTH